MKKVLFLLLILSSVYSVQAQKGGNTPTPVPTAETTSPSETDADTLALSSEVLADLPQSRSEDGGFVLGDPDAPVTIIEFGDWACPHCQSYREVIEPTLLEFLLSGEVNFEFRIFPTAGGLTTVFAGQIAECADDQIEGGFWQSHAILYQLALAHKFEEASIAESIASALDLEKDDLLDCALEAEQVLIDTQLGYSLGISGTPGIMVKYEDSTPQFIVIGRRSYVTGGVPADVLIEVIEGDRLPPPNAGTPV